MSFKNFSTHFIQFCTTIFIIIVLISIGAALSSINTMAPVREPSILKLTLEGPIIDAKQFLENLRKYRRDKNIKGILIHIDSPGGVVGPSQEIYAELLQTREKMEKPVIVSSGAVVASGAYYAALAADQIVTSPGTLMGSIGVIMEFVNLERLYNWAKIKRYTIKAGSLKDAGSDYRDMTLEEREYFQGLLDHVQTQFKSAVVTARNLDKRTVDKYADGRIFTGETAVKIGFADQVGTQSDALKIVGEWVGLGPEPPVFTPPKPSKSELVDLLLNGLIPTRSESLSSSLEGLKLLGKPLYIMPGALGF